MASYSISDLIDKTLYAKKSVVKLYGNPSTPSFKETVGKGAPIGVLYSWAWGGANKNLLYLMFYENKTWSPLYGKPYYVIADGSSLDASYVKEQGVKTVEQKEKEAAEADKKDTKGDFAYYVERWGGTVLGVAAAVYAGVKGFEYYMTNRKK